MLIPTTQEGFSICNMAYLYYFLFQVILGLRRGIVQAANGAYRLKERVLDGSVSDQC